MGGAGGGGEADLWGSGGRGFGLVYWWRNQFSGGGNRSTRRKPPTYGKELTKLFTHTASAQSGGRGEGVKLIFERTPREDVVISSYLARSRGHWATFEVGCGLHK